MSPRRFNRRTYMMVASGRSALTFNAAMSASSASTTIRSAFPFDSKSDGELPRHFWPSSSQVRLRTSAHRHRHLACALGLLCAWVLSRAAYVDELSLDALVPRIQCAKGSGADAGLMGITCYMIRPTARFMYWHQSTMARPSQMAIRLPPHKCGRRFRPRNVITSRNAISF